MLAVSKNVAQQLHPGARPTVSDLAAQVTSGARGPVVQLGAARLSPERVGTILALQAATATRPDGRGALAGLLRAATTSDAPAAERVRAAASDPSAVVPVPEQAVWASGPRADGTLAIYPATATYDYPYAVLSKVPPVQAAAGTFLDLLALPSSQTAIRSAGFRDAQGRPGFDLTADRGVDGAEAASAQRLDGTSLEQAERTLAAVKLDARLLAVVDVSGSMAAYSRMALHLAWALARRGGRIEVFTFATHLTRLTRSLRAADPDVAMQFATRAVTDWDGGTRIGECIAEFNHRWARRVLTRAPWVILLTDGLERAGTEQLETEVTRLARQCRELIWINPLRRSPVYQPLAAGAAVLDRHASRQYTAHNVESLLALGRLVEAQARAHN